MTITLKDVIIAGNDVLLNEQATLLRECRLAINELLDKNPQLAGLCCGTTTLGNLRIELSSIRPRGIFEEGSNETENR